MTPAPSGASSPVTVLGIDLGTSSVKAVVTDTDGRLISQAAAEYLVFAAEPGCAETDPQHWWSAVGAAVHQAVAQSSTQPSAIGLSGQMHGLVMTGFDGAALRPALLWADGRAAPHLAAYAGLGPEALERLANPLTPGMTGPLLLWVAEHEPQIYEQAQWALQAKDWLRYQLTTQAFTEPSDASGTLLYDVPGDRWDTATMRELDLRSELFPTLLPASTSLAGLLTASAATHLGLTAGIPVAAGAADTAAAILGSGLSKPGDLQLTIGTGSQVVTPRITPDARPEAGIHLYRSATDSGWYAMGATLNAGLTLNWVRSVLNADWAELYAAAKQAARPGDPFFLPHLAGERTPYLDPTLRGGWSGIGLAHDRTSLLRSALEGVAFAIRDALDAVPGADAADRLRVTGGGTISAAWRQLLADVLELPLHALDVPGASGRGAALTAVVAAGLRDTADIPGRLAPAARLVAEPSPAAQARVRERRAEFHQLIKSQNTSHTTRDRPASPASATSPTQPACPPDTRT